MPEKSILLNSYKKNSSSDKIESTLVPPHQNAAQTQHLAKLHRMSHDPAKKYQSEFWPSKRFVFSQAETINMHQVAY